MASPRRVEKINNLLREKISGILGREIDFPQDSMVTVTRVEVSPDLLHANIFISIFGEEEKKIFEILGKGVYGIQQKLNRGLRMRPVPKIRFLLDEAQVNQESVEKSVAELQRRGEL